MGNFTSPFWGFYTRRLQDRRGKTWQFTWDANNYGDMLTQKNPLLQTTQYLFNAQHKVIRTIDPANHRTLASYDPTTFDLTQEVTDPKTDPNDGTYSNPTGLAITKSYTYYGNGDPFNVQVGSDPATVYSNYDGYGNARTVTDPLGKQFTATFDSLNQKLSSTEPFPGGTTANGYDLLGRVTSVTHPDTKVISYGYDAADNRTSVTDENSHTTYFDPDVMNRIWRIRQNTTSTTTLTTSFTFNNVGDKTQATNPRNYSTVYAYDERHKLIQVTYPDNTTRKFHYDGNGNRDKRWDGANALTSYTYDDANRLTLSSYPSGATISNRYLADGPRDQMIDPTGTYTWAYNGAHLPTSSYQPQANLSVTYTYDSKGRKQTMAVGGGTWTFGYDSADHPKTISESFGFSPAVTFNYNDNGTLANKLLGNNTRTYYTYDNRDRTTGISHRYFNGSTETEQEAVGYTYDNAGNPLTYSDNQSSVGQSWSTSYGYDWANRLTGEVQTGSAGATFNNQYVYDGNGNRSSVTRNGVATTYNVDNNDKFNFGDGYTFSGYDTNGNPHSIAAGGVTYGLTLDYENQPTQITYTNGTPTSSFLYNGDNLRVRKTDSQGTTVFLYDGSTVIAEATTAGAVTAWYTPGVDFRKSGTSYFNRENGIGSTLQVTGTSGAIADRYEYDSYGVTYTLQQSMYTPYKFAGKHGYYSDGDSGMQLLGHRYYLPSLGRFLTQDPLGHEAGLNLYQYANQNPLVKIDPDGRAPVDSVRASMVAAITTRNWNELSEILRSLPAYTSSQAQVVFQPVYGMVSRLFQPIATRFPPQSFMCTEAAQNLAGRLEERGVPYEVLEVNVGRRLAVQPMGTWERFTSLFSRQAVYSNTGYHTAVRVYDRVYDTVSGSNGLQYSQWLQKAGVKASEVGVAFQRTPIPYSQH